MKIISEDISRLDKVIIRYLEEGGYKEFSRQDVISWVKSGLVAVNDVVVLKQSYKVDVGDVIVFEPPLKVESSLKKVDIKLDIIYEDGHIIVLDKSPFITVHPGSGTKDDTLVHALLYHTNGNLASGGFKGGESHRPGIVHRLDRDTSGLMVVAKSEEAYNILTAKIANREIERRYIAFCWGIPIRNAGVIDANIDRSKSDRTKMQVVNSNHMGKKAVTHYKLLKSFCNSFSMIECKLETGRTHQIRVHLASIKLPIIGDKLYAKSFNPKIDKEFLGDEKIEKAKNMRRQALHAYKLKFAHPITEEIMEFESYHDSNNASDIIGLC